MDFFNFHPLATVMPTQETSCRFIHSLRLFRLFGSVGHAPKDFFNCPSNRYSHADAGGILALHSFAKVSTGAIFYALASHLNAIRHKINFITYPKISSFAN
jgi:hypothetical protein